MIPSSFDQEPRTKELHPCSVPCPTKSGAPCGRWLGTIRTPDGWRCSVHGPKPRNRMRNPRDVVRALEHLEPTLRSVLAWLEAHR